MAVVVADRVKETTTTTGTGTYSLAGAETGFRTFVAGVGTTNSCHYCATDGVDWEVGLGTVTDASPDTLTRTTILSSSNGGAAVNWSAGTKDVFLVAPAAMAISPVEAFTPTGSWNTNVVYTGMKWTVGKMGFAQYQIAFSGAPNAANLTLNLPSGWTLNTALLTSTSGAMVLPSSGSSDDPGVAFRAGICCFYSSTTVVAVYFVDTTSSEKAHAFPVNATLLQTWVNGDALWVNLGPIPLV